jgi:anti-sigma factor RsiW
MTCETLVDLVTARLEGALDAGTERRFAEHLAGCGDCRAYLDQVRATVRLLGGLPVPPLSGAARGRLLAAFRAWPGPGPAGRGHKSTGGA